MLLENLMIYLFLSIIEEYEGIRNYIKGGLKRKEN
jgi:hypothetical protein